MDENLKLIKRAVQEVLGERLDRVILFGSRARGESSKHSDYDVLVVVREEMSAEDRIDTAEEIRSKLADLELDVDVLVKTGRDMEYFSDKIGSIVKAALEEGVVL